MRKPAQAVPRYDHVQKYAEYWAFADWLSTPSPLRKIKNQHDFAKEHSLHENTLGRWKTMPEFRRDVDMMVSKKMTDHTADVSYALINRIFKEGGAAEVRAFREWAHEYTPTIKLEHSGSVDAEIGDDTVSKIAKKFEDELRVALASPKK